MDPVRNGECAREADVLEAVSMGRWPECSDRDLVAHVASCATCAEVADIAFALQDHRRALTSSAPVPTSAVVWWKAQRRARTEAARAATRPIRIVQGIGLVCGLAALVAAVVFVSPVFARWFGGLSALPSATDVSASVSQTDASVSAFAVSAFAMMRWVWPLAIGVCLLLAPLAVYFVMKDEA